MHPVAQGMCYTACDPGFNGLHLALTGIGENMGCDIHGFWEMKTPHGWVAFETINDSRRYSWFGIVGGVRRDVESETAMRGIPDDSSAAWRQYTDSWDSGLHSHTWLTPDEVKEANQRLFMDHMKDDGLAFNPGDLDAAIDYHETVPEISTEVRCIFLPGPRGNNTQMFWSGTIGQNIQTDELETHLRMVIAFDN